MSKLCKCPYCQKVIENFNMEQVDCKYIQPDSGKDKAKIYKCISLICPHCEKIISAQVDKLIAQDVMKELVDSKLLEPHSHF